MVHRAQAVRLVSLCVAVLALAPAAGAASLEVRGGPEDPARAVVARADSGSATVLRETAAAVEDARLVAVPDAGVAFAAWDERGPAGIERWVSLSKDGGESWARARAVDLSVPLRAGRLLPGVEAPWVAPALRARAESRLFLVQFETPGLAAWRKTLEGLGAEVLVHVPHQAWVVRVERGQVPALRAQPFVRWVGPYEPGWRVDPEVVADVLGASATIPRRYHVMTFAPGAGEKERLAAEIRALGGRIDLLTPNGFRIEATLTPDQVLALAHSDRLAWIDRWTPREKDMDLVREVAGTNYVETVAGFSGQGVRGEVMDAGFQLDHPDFDGILVHGPTPGVDSHGTSTFGIVFGNGDRDGDGQAKGTGHLPSKEAGWVYDYSFLTDRYQETAEVVSAPIYGLFQSNSWGDARTRSYTSISQEMDDIIWQYDLPIFQSQSNAGNQDSRPQAWAKNIISIGAVNHYDTATLADDCWCSTGSIGPAEDGRIKPDLAYWYDSIYTTTTGSGYTAGFGGTSAATPVTAGIGGLILQMWGANVLGNDPQGATLFDKRPHAATLKAMMINTAEPYPFAGAGADNNRFHQGWGLASARRFYDRRALLQVVDEEHLLEELDVHSYTASVPAGQPELKVTLAYTDRAGTTSSLLHRINDVSVKVTDPAGTTVYHGNVGLTDGNWSVPGGSPDGKNNVENVWIENPAAGAWTIDVEATDLNQDQFPGTPEVDQDYALVVYGADALDFGCPVPPQPPTGLVAENAGDNAVRLTWTGVPTSRGYRIYRAAGGCSGTFAKIGGAPKTQTTFTDTAASGGLVYGYRVTSAEGCESEPTACVEITATGPCIRPPAFTGLASATDDGTASCGVTLSWPAASGACGGPVVYNVYRGTSASFVPSASNRVANCLPGTSWKDTRGLVSNTVYHYAVRAEDLAGRGSAECGGVGETNAVKRTAQPRGPAGSLVSTTFETGLEGWTVAPGTPAATAGAWVGGVPVGSSDGGAPASPSVCAQGQQCLFTGLNKGGAAKNGDVDGGETIATSPVFNASGFSTARLTYSRWHYNNAAANDSGDRFAMEVSRDGGATWQALDTLGARASANAWTPKQFDLETGGALTAQMRLRARSADGTLFDDILESGLDDVVVTGQQACTSAALRAPGAIPATLSVEKDTASSRLAISWSADCGGGTGYGLYRGDLDAGWGSAAPVPGYCGIAAPTAYVLPGAGNEFFLVAPNDGSAEGTLGLLPDGTRRPQPASHCLPRAAAVDACAP